MRGWGLGEGMSGGFKDGEVVWGEGEGGRGVRGAW